MISSFVTFSTLLGGQRGRDSNGRGHPMIHASISSKGLCVRVFQISTIQNCMKCCSQFDYYKRSGGCKMHQVYLISLAQAPLCCSPTSNLFAFRRSHFLLCRLRTGWTDRSPCIIRSCLTLYPSDCSRMARVTFGWDMMKVVEINWNSLKYPLNIPIPKSSHYHQKWNGLRVSGTLDWCVVNLVCPQIRIRETCQAVRQPNLHQIL